MPDPGFLPEGLWGDEYRAMGGITVPDYLQQMQSNADMYGLDMPEPEAAPAPRQQYLTEDQFVDWPTYQGIVSDKLKPHEAYDEYLTTILPLQLKQMGYGDEDAQAEIQGFAQMVPAPAADYGFLGNLWESLKGGAKSGTRAEAATGNVVQGDLDDIAKLVTEQATGPRPNAPLQRFQQAISTPEAQNGFWDAVKAYAGAAWNEKEGALNFLVEQAAQSYPSIAGGAGGAAAGALAGPLGALLGGMAGVGAGSGSVEVGSQILERIASEAQARGIDPRDTNAIRAMINDPEVYANLRNAAVAKGLIVGAADTAVAAFSFGMGKAGANALRAGSKLRATGLAGGGVLGESAGSAGGEALSQIAAGDQFNYSDIVGEAFGEFGPGAAHVLTGALMPHKQQPGVVPPGDLDQSDLPATGEEEVFPGGIDVTEIPTEAIDYQVPGGVPRFGEVGAEQIGVQELPTEEITLAPAADEPPLTVEEITLQPLVDSAELRIREGRLLPQLPPGRANPALIGDAQGVGTPQQRDDARIAFLTTPQAVDLDTKLQNEENLLAWMSDRGVNLASEEQRAIVADLMGTRPGDRQAFIADAVEGLAASREAGAEPLAQAMLAISRAIPRERTTQARAQQLLETALPGTPVAEIPKVVASEMAQKVMDDLAAGVTEPGKSALPQWAADQMVAQGLDPNRPLSGVEVAQPTMRAAILADPTMSEQEKQNVLATGSPRGRTNAIPTTQPAAPAANTITVSEAVAPDLNRVDADTPVVHGKRGLKRGEPVPTAGGLGGLVGQIAGPGPASSAQAPVQQSRGGLRNRVNQEGTGGGGRGGAATGGKATLAGRGAGRTGTQPVGTTGAARVQRLDEARAATEQALAAHAKMFGITEASRAAAIAEAVRKHGGQLAPPIKVELSTTPTERRYGTQAEDTANKEALREQRDAAKAKKATGGLSNKAKKAAKAKAAKMDKAEYEKTYPGRDYDADMESITRATGANISENMGVDPIGRLDQLWKELQALRGPLEQASLGAQQNDVHNRINILAQFLNKQIPWYREQLANAERGVAEGWVTPDMRAKLDAQNNSAIDRQIVKVDALRREANAVLGISENLEADPDTHDTYVSLSDADLLDMQHRTAAENLQMLASRTRNPIARALALHMATLDMPTMLRLRRLRVPGKYVYQEAADGSVINDAVLLDPHKPLGRTVEAAIHEYAHAATTHAYYAPQTEEQKAAVRKIDALYEYVKSKVPESQAYGFKSAPEFISEAFSNFEFQKLLNSVMVPETNVSLWTAFKELVMQLVGRYVKRGSAMHKLLNEIEPLLSAERGGLTQRGLGSVQANSPPASNAKANAIPSSAIVGTKDGARTFIAYAKDKNDPNTKYTIYPTNAQFYKGDPAGKLVGLTRAQVEQHITVSGSTVVPPATDTSVKSGTPKNTSTKQVGYDNNGNLQSAAFEQKDGTWTYYESNDDVRTDPDARVTKGLSKDAVQRYITARGLAAEPPKNGVKPDGTKPTSVGYEPASWKRRMFQDEEGTLLNIGGKVGEAAELRNSRVQQKLKQVDRQYVEPVRKAGLQLTARFGKTEAEIFDLMQALHVVERMQTKMQQFYRGNLQGAELTNKQQDLFDKQQAAQAKVNAVRGSNPAYVKAVEQELAPKLKAMADNTIDMNAQYGFLDRDSAENIKAAYDYYVPLQSEDTRTTVGKAATGASVTGDLTFARMVEQAQRTITRGEQNRVRQEVRKLVGTSGLLKINKDKTTENPVTIGPVHKIRYNKDTNSLDSGEDNFVFDRDAIDVYTNGVRERMKITDPSLLDALHPFKGEDRPAGVTAAITAIAQINHLISIGKTSLNPAWPPFNFARDILTSNLNLPAGVSRAKYWAELINPKNYASVLWNVGREAFGKDPVGGYADADAAGAFISHRAFIGLDPIAHSVQAMFKPPLASFDKKHLYGLSQKGTKVGEAGKTLFNFLSIYPQVAESVPRMAMYKAALASGLSKESAARAAKNASVNFERRGKVPLSNYWIFGNAKMQGVHALYKTYERHGLLWNGMAAMSIIGLGALAAALGYEWSEKDKDGKSKYIKVPDFKKDSMLLFAADGYGVPIPQEISPFYVLGNATAEAIMGGVTPGKAAARFLTSGLNNIWPGSVAQQDPVGHNANVADFMTRMLVPSQLSPLYDTATNRNTFGREVVSGMEDKTKRGIPKSEMGSPNENQLAVNAAKGLYQATDGKVDMAPQQIKLWNNFFNPAAEGYGFWRDLFGGREEKYVGDVVNPFARKFSGMATEFYDQEQFDELLAKAKRAKYLAEQPGRGGINALSPEDQVLARSAGMLQKVESDGNALFKGYKLMTPERRKLLNERKRDLVLGGIRRYNEMRDQSK